MPLSMLRYINYNSRQGKGGKGRERESGECKTNHKVSKKHFKYFLRQRVRF